MKIVIVGGTGFLGSASAAELIRRGNHVRSISLPPILVNSNLPVEMDLTFGNFNTMSDDELKEQLNGFDAMVFAAGVDERVEFPAPALSYYYKYNVAPVERFLHLGKQCGLKRAVIMGSYFAYFAKQWPEMKLSEYHPYIKSRILQEEKAISYNGGGMDVMVLELPYIFGIQPGRKPVWTFLVEMIQRMKIATLYTKGGTTMVTVNQVAQAVVGAIEKGKGGTCYPVGWYNLTWKEMLAIFHKYMNIPRRKIITIPSFIYRAYARKIMNDYMVRGIDPGLDLVRYVDIQTAYTYIDKSIISVELGVTEDDLDKAIGESVKLCLDVIAGKKELLEMKAE